MITGFVNAHREAVLRLALLDANGNQHPSDVVVDTLAQLLEEDAKSQ